MNSASHHFIAGQILKVAAAGRMLGMMSRIPRMPAAASGRLAGSASGRLPGATPRLSSPMSRMLGNPNFQQVLESSQSGFPKLPGLNLLSPSTQKGILRPGAAKALPGGTMNQMQQTLTAARPAMAKTIRGFRGLQRQGVM